MVGYSLPDKFALEVSPEIYVNNGSWGANSGFTDTLGRTVRNLTINPSIRNLILIIAGQSNGESVAPTAYTLTNPSAIDNFNIYDGAVYAWQDPPLGCTYGAGGVGTPTAGPGHMGGRIADLLINGNLFDRIIVCPVNIGGSAVFSWIPFQTASGSAILQNRLPVLFSRLESRGFVAGTNVTTAFLWIQGEAEGTLGFTTTEEIGYLNQLITYVKGFDPTIRIFISQETWSGGVVYPQIQNAQAAVADGFTVFAGGDLDSLGNSYRQDTTHFNDAGMAAAALLQYNAMVASGYPF